MNASLIAARWARDVGRRVVGRDVGFVARLGEHRPVEGQAEVAVQLRSNAAVGNGGILTTALGTAAQMSNPARSRPARARPAVTSRTTTSPT